MSVSNSTFTNNTALTGGAIFTSQNDPSVGDVSVSNSTFTNNKAGTLGGAIFAGSEVSSVSNSTFTNNRAVASGGAIFAGANVSVTYSTFTGNTATEAGSAIRLSGVGTAFGSVFVKPPGTVDLCFGDLVTGGTFTSLGYNYANETANSCNLTATGDSSLDANDAKLGGLGDNGGPTPTQLPQSGSPLINAIPNAACQTAPLATGITTDQRHLARPEQTGGTCDIGAVEVQLPPAAVTVTPKFTG